VSADGLQVLYAQLDGLRRGLDYLERRLQAVEGSVNSVSRPGGSAKLERLHGARSAQGPNASEAILHMQQTEHHVQGATRYVDSWLNEILRIIDAHA
jgi:hypothetical protein